MDHITLLQNALEMLLDGDQLEAAHAFRELAEELEEGSTLDPGEVGTLLQTIVESY
jgi:hypothetical protein